MALRKLCIALAAVLLPGISAAQMPAPIAIYDASGNQLPDAYDANWVKVEVGSPSYSVSGGQLTVSSTDTSTDRVYWEWSSPGFTTPPNGWTAIVRASIGTATPHWRPVFYDVSEPTGGITEALGLGGSSSTDAPALNRYRLTRSSMGGGVDDTSVIHEYWYVQTETLGGSLNRALCEFYIDGVMVQDTGGVPGIDGDYVRLGIFDVGHANSANEYIIEYLAVYDEPISPTPVPTATPIVCPGNIVNCGFESGNLSGWTATGGEVVIGGGGTYCVGPWPFEGDYAYWQVVNMSSLSGSMYQVVTPDVGVGTVQASCMLRDAAPCQLTDGTVRIGVDPTAGTDVGAGTVNWGAPVDPDGSWTQIVSAPVSVSSPYTIFIEWDLTEGGGGWCFVNLDLVQVNEFAPATYVPNWESNP